jgi:aldehyde:ferredoxin oxidoreductase
LISFYGLELTADDVSQLGRDILSWERDFNNRAGFTKAHDRLPMYFYREKLEPHNAVFEVKGEGVSIRRISHAALIPPFPPAPA